MENRENHGPAVHADAARCGDNEALDAAWDWLCAARKSAPADADIWDLRFHWETTRTDFLQQLQTGKYRLSPMRVTGRNQRMMWTARDALALKWLAVRIQGQLPLHEKCEHVKGHGGGKSSVVRLSSAVQTGEYPWVCRTDIRGYYGSVDKARLLSQLKQHITRPAYLSLLEQYLYYSTEDGGDFHTPEKGIARGCALSPLMGALHLWVVDDYFARQKNIRYARYMDDFVILAKSRWSLRRQVKALNRRLSGFGFVKHPDKTFIGRVQRGFDWLGAWLTDRGVTGVAPRAVKNYYEKVRRLYERTRHWLKEKQAKRVSDYRRRWFAWVGCMCFISAVPTPSEAADIEVRNGSGFVLLKSGMSLSGSSNGKCTSDREYVYALTHHLVDGAIVGYSSDGLAYGLLVPGSGDMYVVQNGVGTFAPNNRSAITVRWSYGGPPTWTGGQSVTYSTYTSVYSVYMAIGSDFGDYVGGSATGSLDSSLYVGPKTRPGTYNLGSYVTRFGCGVGAASLTDVNTNVIVKSFACTINAPRTVEFGDITVKGEPVGTLLRSVNTSLDVTCSMAGPVNATLTFSGEQDSNGLGLWNEDHTQLSPAHVMGTMTSVSGATTDGCSQTTTTPGAIRFDGNASASAVSIPGHIPLRFDLCKMASDREGRVGVFTGNATVTVNWD